MAQRDTIQALLDYARRFVTQEDIANYVVGDPGYRSYIRTWTNVLVTGNTAGADYFDLSENINIRMYRSSAIIAPDRFRRFRVFLIAAGMQKLCNDETWTDMVYPNYLLIRLLEDQEVLDDDELGALIDGVLIELHEVMKAADETETPFVLLALILLRLHRGIPPEALVDLADDLIKEEQERRASGDNWNPTFLLGITNFDSLHKHWRTMTARRIAINITVPELRLVRDAVIE